MTGSNSAAASRALLILNSRSGAGHDAALAPAMRDRLATLLPGCVVELALTSTHAEIRESARSFVARSTESSALLVGGGSGSLRAAVEGACAAMPAGSPLPSAERLRIAPLRMGSGNLVAKALGCVKDATLGLERAAQGLRAGRVRPCTVLRVDAGMPGGGTRTSLGVAMGGFGAFGRVASDVERWPRRFPRARRVAAELMGIETWTNVEYGGAIVLRGLAHAMAPSTCERVTLTHDGRTRTLRLLAGLLFAFRIPEYPFDPGTRFGEEQATLHVVELPESAWKRAGLVVGWRPGQRLIRGAEALRLERGRRVRLELVDRSEAEFFLDEDPEPFTGWLEVSVAGSLAVVPGAAGA